MKKKWAVGVLIALAIFILADVLAVTGMTSLYPSRTITCEQLLDPEYSTIYGLKQETSGMLLAEEDDPWIVFDLGESTAVRTVSVYTDGADGTAGLTVYLLPQWETVYTSVSAEPTHVMLPVAWSQQRSGVTELRVAPTQQQGSAVKIDRIELNSWSELVLEMQLVAFCILLLCALLAIEAVLWRRTLRQPAEGTQLSRRDKVGWIVPAAVQWGLKAALLTVMLRNLLGNDAGSRLRLLSWLMVLSLEGLSVCVLLLRRTDRRRWLWGQMALLPLWAVCQFSAIELMNMANFDFRSMKLLLLNLLVCCILPLFLMVLLRRGALALPISGLILMVWGIANHFFGDLRGNPLEYSDILQAGTAANVASNYEFTPDSVVIGALLAFLCASVCLLSGLGLKSWEGSRWRSYGKSLPVAVGALVLTAVLLPQFGLGEAWNLSAVSQSNGYLVSFLSYARAGLQGDKPQGYTAQKTEEILSAYESDSPDSQSRHPNVIAIMNEAFSDLPELYGFSTEEDGMPFIHSLEENTVKGSLLVSVAGGGTANTEYEFLTGNSLYMLPAGSCPYVQYISTVQQSFAWSLQRHGYTTAAYHPFYSNGYRRESNYPLLGLSPFYDMDADLPHQGCLRWYLSDESDFRNIISMYEERQTDEPFSVFNVTMQNHGSYSADKPAVDVTVEPNNTNLRTSELEEYLALVRETDRAFEMLVDYFSQVDEDTIILMFGDHQPSLGEKSYNELESFYGEEEAKADSQAIRFQSSFVLWANFDLESASGVLTSPNYLRAMLLNAAGLELSPYERFLLEVQKEYPAMNAFGYYDADWNWHDRTDENGQDELLWQYQCMVYQNVFDKKHMNAALY